jgi:NADH-quinone oxidoreductase subunit E
VSEIHGEPQSVPRFAHGSRVPGWDEAVDLAKDPAGVPDPATTPVPAELREEIEAHMAKYPDRRSAALPALAAAQRLHGWLSPEAIDQVACAMRLTPGYLIAVATFYDMFELRPVGAHSVYVCTNISCSLCGADELYDEFRRAAAEDPEFNVRAFECLGACDLAPMASVDGVYVGPLTPADVAAVLDDARAGRPVLPDRQLARRLVADPHANTREFPQHEPVVAAVTGPHLEPAVGAPPPDEDRLGPSAALEEAEPVRPDTGEPEDGGDAPGGLGGAPSAGSG